MPRRITSWRDAGFWADATTTPTAAAMPSLTDKGGSVVLTYWPSEFSQMRGQYRFTHYANNIDANELFVQLIFSLGAHGAHPF